MICVWTGLGEHGNNGDPANWKNGIIPEPCKGDTVEIDPVALDVLQTRTAIAMIRRHIETNRSN